MKKQFLILALLITGVMSARAQAILGIKGGVNFSKINTDNLKESTVAGYQVGLYGRIGNSWYLQPELYLGSRGGKFETNNNTADAKVTFTTLNVPLLVGRKLVSVGSVNIRAMAGPIYSYNLSKDIKDAFTDFGQYKNSTLGFQAGGGVDIGNITADLRYEGGLTKINEKYGQRANLWALSIGFKIL